jgi:hypothetical protein
MTISFVPSLPWHWSQARAAAGAFVHVGLAWKVSVSPTLPPSLWQYTLAHAMLPSPAPGTDGNPGKE